VADPLPPAVTATDLRLDAVIARLDRIADLLAPKPSEPADGEAVELREPAADEWQETVKTLEPATGKRQRK
jgi:hypothetical protein